MPSGEGKRRVLDALVEALDLSIDNLQDIVGYSAIGTGASDIRVVIDNLVESLH